MCEVRSVDETNELAKAVKVYPTLVTEGSITIEATKHFGQTNLSIFDMQGKEVLNQVLELNSNKNTLSISLNSGIYIMKFEANGMHGYFGQTMPHISVERVPL